MVKVTQEPESERQEPAKFRRSKKTERGEAVEVWEEDAGVFPAPVGLHTATISLTLGFSFQPRQFESIKGEVFLSVPCDLDELDEIYERLYSWVDKRVGKMGKEAREPEE